MSHPDVGRFARALAEFEIREFVEELGYSFQTGPQGVIVLIPSDFDESTVQYADPQPGARYILGADLQPRRQHEGGDECADCGVKLTALDRCQTVVPNPAGGLGFTLRFVCPEHYRNPKA
ncbi:hypothetical protein Jolie2_47 [Mycobacterium phage Jolie2]|uniref:Uncharacterized protein n=1 Tax=Mycobacterium phage Jolie2 TaxID=1458831 RepID=W8ED24_9CAUD|nr:hypothetical protein Jolie2_47 [Mycobacterium phage Jolie2]AHJ86597.1 hypothetical protein Jolie2_47 [Mycobacterium phage Jolie2]